MSAAEISLLYYLAGALVAAPADHGALLADSRNWPAGLAGVIAAYRACFDAVGPVSARAETVREVIRRLLLDPADADRRRAALVLSEAEFAYQARYGA